MKLSRQCSTDLARPRAGPASALLHPVGSAARVRCRAIPRELFEPLMRLLFDMLGAGSFILSMGLAEAIPWMPRSRPRFDVGACAPERRASACSPSRTPPSLCVSIKVFYTARTATRTVRYISVASCAEGTHLAGSDHAGSPNAQAASGLRCCRGLHRRSAQLRRVVVWNRPRHEWRC